MSKKKTAKDNTAAVAKTSDQPKKRLFNVEKRFGYTMHEIWTHKMSYGLVAPFFILFITFSLLPLLASLYLSFCYWNILESPVFTGWQNYRYLFVDDSLFLKAFSNTLYYAIIVGPTAYIASYFFAWFINQVPAKVRPIYTLAFYAPSLTSAIAMSVVWAVMFSNDSTGYLNSLLLKLNIISDPVQWLQDVKWIMPVGIIVALWSSLGTGFLSFVAGFTNVDKELYDAAAVDGVTSRFQRLLYVDIPQTMPQLLFAAVLQITGSLSVGGTLAGHPTPEDAGLTVMLHLSDYSGTRFEVGYASAIAVVLSLLIFGLGRAAFKILSDKG
ncbi:MAG: sugar ABC transporter permease [Clostridia bacterium]|nr:sugar ABC transporter permease [Clostridia bacterium]MBR7062863.1 sugar ABC transporter permease [Clostridia bacterium]